ncbi:MAG: hypothetical protein NC935_08875 [Candidatus Omnitrophica bacterium]|nr:hypothetical protein [Candidatus Omnitrophota bacterium]
MKFYNSKIVEKARVLRKQGLSLRKIEQKIKVPSSTISKWVRDIKVDNSFYKKARLIEKVNKDKFKYLAKEYKIDKNLAKVLLSFLYWCEGSKYPATNRVNFSNSDYLMVKMFIKLLRISFKIKEEKIRVHLQLHASHNIKKEINFWSQLLKVPISQFEKPTITKPTNNMKRLNYRGTCTIKYYDVKLLLQITGIYESFTEIFIKEESDSWSIRGVC